jgi:hypothetical protein
MTLTPSVRAISLCSFPRIAKSFACASFVAISTLECLFFLAIAACSPYSSISAAAGCRTTASADVMAITKRSISDSENAAHREARDRGERAGQGLGVHGAPAGGHGHALIKFSQTVPTETGDPMSALGHLRRINALATLAACPLCLQYRPIGCLATNRREVPCVDGSELARVFFTFAGWSVQPCVRPVSAAHRPLAIMPSADQVPVKSSHSTMRWH